MLSFGSESNPSWNGKKTTGIGWKLLTKSTFGHFALASQNADVINPSRGIPDNREPSGLPLLKPNGMGGIDIGGLSMANIDSLNNGIDTIVR